MPSPPFWNSVVPDLPGITVALSLTPAAVRAVDEIGLHGYLLLYHPGPIPPEHAATLAMPNVRVCKGVEGIRDAVRGLERWFACGVRVLEPHARLDEEGDRFLSALNETLKAMRIGLVTNSVLMPQFFQNALDNLPAFVECGGVAGLKDRAKHVPAVIVSAGPSLARNVDLLKGREDEFVIVAVQTALKTLLGRGIRPHYVCAVDFHPTLSTRFFEGVTAEMVEGVELVMMPTACPGVARAWPGAMRMTGDPLLSAILEDDTVASRGMFPTSATVAHFGYHLARHLGCDPVILIGQDLGFTDGAYYSAGAAIHQVWAGELNEFNTLEMMEWQRVARGRDSNRLVEDQQGRPMYTDAQMATYLDVFNALFRADRDKGLTTIDATEGGARKDAVEPMTLREALERHGGEYHFLRYVPAEARPDGSYRREEREVIALLQAMAGHA